MVALWGALAAGAGLLKTENLAHAPQACLVILIGHLNSCLNSVSVKSPLLHKQNRLVTAVL